MESDELGDLLDFGDAVEAPLAPGAQVNDLLFAGMEIKTEPDEVQDMMRKSTTQLVDDTVTTIDLLDGYKTAHPYQSTYSTVPESFPTIVAAAREPTTAHDPSYDTANNGASAEPIQVIQNAFESFTPASALQTIAEPEVSRLWLSPQHKPVLAASTELTHPETESAPPTEPPSMQRAPTASSLSPRLEEQSASPPVPPENPTELVSSVPVEDEVRSVSAQPAEEPAECALSPRLEELVESLPVPPENPTVLVSSVPAEDEVRSVSAQPAEEPAECALSPRLEELAESLPVPPENPTVLVSSVPAEDEVRSVSAQPAVEPAECAPAPPEMQTELLPAPLVDTPAEFQTPLPAPEAEVTSSGRSEPAESAPGSEITETETPLTARTSAAANTAQEQHPAEDSNQSHHEQERLLRFIIGTLGAELALEEGFLPETLDGDTAKEVVALLVSALRVHREARAPSIPILPTAVPSLATSEARAPSIPILPTPVPSSATSEAGAEGDAAPAPSRAEPAAWEEVDEEHPVPTYGLESPVIAHLLSTWTTDASKVDFLKSWVRSLYMPSYEDLNYPPGLQITNLSCVLRDGFMVLLVPLIRSLSKHAVVVHVRKHTPSAAGSGATEDAFSDPFVQEESALYDIRIKRRDVTLGTEGGVMSSSIVPKASTPPHREGLEPNRDRVHSHDKATSSGFRTDSHDYSSLSEINASLSAIETSATRESAAIRSIHKAHALHAAMSHEHGHEETSATLRRVASRTGETPTIAAPMTVPVPAAPTQPSPSLLQSLFSWWDPTTASSAVAPTPTAVAASAAALIPPESTALGAEDGATVEDSPAAATGPAGSADDDQDDASSTSSTEQAENEVSSVPPAPERDSAGTDTSTSTAAAALSVNVSPVSKIAEKLQQIREQKMQYQQKNRDKSRQAEDKK